MAVEFADEKPEGFDDAGAAWEIVPEEVPDWLKDWPSSEGRTTVAAMTVRHSVLKLHRVRRYVEPGRGVRHRVNRKNGVYVASTATMQLVVTSHSSGAHTPRTKTPSAGDLLQIFGVLHNADGVWKMVGVTIYPVYAPSNNRWRVDVTSGPEAIPEGFSVVDVSGVADLVAETRSGH